MEARALPAAPPRKSSPKASRESAVIADQTEKVLGLARESFDMVRKREPDRERVSSTLSSYREALEALAKLVSKEPWRLEREILPDELKNVPMGAYGLPKTIAPLSLSNSLANRELDRIIEGLEFRTDELATISKLLDRYVRVDFPDRDISEFYRPAVEQLRERQGRLTPEAYLSEVILLARELTEKHHNLKIDLHKNQCTQTGGSLAQSDSDDTSRSKKKIQPIKKPAHGSPHESIGSSLRLRWGAPVIDNLPTGKKHSPPKKAELETQLRPVAPEGERGWLLAHPDLPGMLFTSEQCAEAFSLVVNADFFTVRSNSKVKMPEDQAPIIEALREIKEFRVACHMKDRKGQLKIVLEILQLELHAAEIIDRNIATELRDAWQMAREDFQRAYQWMEDFEKEKDAKLSAMTSTPVRRMIQIWNASRHVAPFDIALAVALEMRGDRKSIVTERPSFTAIATEEFEEARPSLKSPKPLALPEEWMDPDLEERLPKEEDDFSQALRKHARRLRYLVAMGDPGEAEELYRPAVEKLTITYSVEALVRHATELAEAELGPEEETTQPGALAPIASTDEDAAPERAETRKETPAPSAVEEPEQPAPTVPSPRKGSKTQPLYAAGAAEASGGQAYELRRPAKTLVFEPDEETQPHINPDKIMLGRLNQNDLELVMSILGRQGSCNEAELAEFRAMDSGVRDLRFRNALAAVWTEDDWRGQPEIGEPSKAEHMRSCMNNLYSVCGLAPATLEQMKAAVTDPSNLTIGQLAAISRFFAINPGNITRQNVEDFGVWLGCDRQKLKDYWARNYPETMDVVRLAQKMATYEATGARKRTFTKAEYATLGLVFGKTAEKIDINDVKDIPAVTAYAKQLQLYHERWFAPSAEQRQNFWKSESANMLSVSDLVHRVLFVEEPAFNGDDARVVAAVYGQSDDVAGAAESLTAALHNKAQNKTYHQEVLMVYDNIFQGRDPVAHLLVLARAKEEFSVLSDFLGVQTARAYGKLVKADSECRCKFEVRKVQDASGQKYEMTCVGVYDSQSGTITLPNGEQVQAASVANRMKVIREETVQVVSGGANVTGTKLVSYAGIYNLTNDDAIAQAQIQLPDGREIELDAVFDGMGGHSTGYVASGIHKAIFEICALSGLIMHPEDVRRVVVMADIAITIESINRKKKDAGGNFVHSKDIQENNMGTTAAVSFLCGNELYVIHCGDSPIEVFDESGQLVAATVDHALVNDFLANEYTLKDQSGQSNRPSLVAAAISKYGTGLRVVDNSKQFTLYETDFISAKMDGMTTHFAILRNGQVVCEGTGVPILHEKLVEVLDIPNGNVVTAAVGNSIRKTSVNNVQRGQYSAWTVRDGMVVSVTSDGIRVPLCAHEIPRTIGQCGGDLQKSAHEIVDTAEARTPNGVSSFSPECGCNERGSKNDDKSVILKRIGSKKK